MQPAVEDFAVSANECRDFPAHCAERFRCDGLLVIRDVLPVTDCDHLRERVERQQHQAQTRPPIKWADDFYLTIASPYRRYDLKLHLTDAEVAKTLRSILGGRAHLAEILERVAGLDASLCEVHAISAEFGAVQQGWHRDTSLSAGRAVVTVFAALQKTTRSRGATLMKPRSHEPTPQKDNWNDNMYESLAVELEPGDCCLMDSRLQHCGGAHTDPSLSVRVLFSISFLICGTTAQGMIMRESYVHKFCLSDWRQWTCWMASAAIWDGSRKGCEATTTPGESRCTRKESSSVTIPWPSCDADLHEVRLEVMQGLPVPTVDKGNGILVPCAFRSIVAAIMCADARDLYFARFAPQWPSCCTVTLQEFAAVLLGPAPMMRSAHLACTQEMMRGNETYDSLFWMRCQTLLDKVSDVASEKGLAVTALRASGLSDDYVVLSCLVFLHRCAISGRVDNWGKELDESEPLGIMRQLTMCLEHEPEGWTQGFAWAPDISDALLDYLPASLASAAKCMRAELHKVHSHILSAWISVEGLVPPTFAELCHAQGWLENLLAGDEALPTGLALLRRGSCSTANPKLDFVGPLHLDAGGGATCTRLAVEREHVLSINGVPSQHWLRMPATAAQLQRRFAELDQTGGVLWSALPLGGGVSPEAVRYLRILLSENPMSIPIDVALFSEPQILELDVMCIDTLLATIEKLENEAIERAAAYHANSMGQMAAELILQREKIDLGTAKPPVRFCLELARYHRSQADLLSANAFALKQLLEVGRSALDMEPGACKQSTKRLRRV